MKNFRYLSQWQENTMVGKALAHFEKFYFKHNALWPQNVILGVSAGAESILLLHLARSLSYKYKSKKTTAIHVNYQSRPESQDEEDYLNQICDRLDIELKVCRQKLDSTSSNFEQKARKIRYQYFIEHLKGPKERVFLAHHIDDSIEWALMQNFKTSKGGLSLGIPVKTNIVFRPLHCFTKAQIKNILKFSKVKWMEDSSNFSNQYERNFIRNIILPEIKNRFPKYQKHFVSRMQEDATKHHFFKSKMKNEAMVKKLGNGLYLVQFIRLKKLPAFYLKEVLNEVLEEISGRGRGIVYEQMEILVKSLRKGMAGPIHFSGGVKVTTFKGMAYFKGTQKGGQVGSHITGPHSFSLDELMSFLNQRKKHEKFPLLAMGCCELRGGHKGSNEQKGLNIGLSSLKGESLRKLDFLDESTLSMLQALPWVRTLSELIQFWQHNERMILKVYEFSILWA